MAVSFISWLCRATCVLAPLAHAPSVSFGRSQELSLVDCDLRAVSSRLGDLPNLRHLLLYRNPLGESEMAFMMDEWWPRPNLVGHLSGLETLSLAGCQIMTLPMSFTALRGLTRLDLRGNFLQGVRSDFKPPRGQYKGYRQYMQVGICLQRPLCEISTALHFLGKHWQRGIENRDCRQCPLTAFSCVTILPYLLAAGACGSRPVVSVGLCSAAVPGPVGQPAVLAAC